MIGILVALLFSLVPTIVIIMIIVALVKKKKEGENSESFEQIIRTIYVYVILITLMITMVSSMIFAFNSAINYYIPDSTVINNTTKSYSSYSKNQALEKLIEENDLNNEKNQSLIDMATALTMVFVSAPMFMYYSKLAKKIKQD